MRSFQNRLEAAQVKGDLRVSDLQAWFGRPYHTILGWLNGAEPHDHRTEILRRLDLLERTIRAGRLPVPYSLKHSDRRAHVEGALRAASKRLPGARAAR